MWRLALFREGNTQRERLLADRCTGHPHIDPTVRMHTSPLVWIHEAVGWALTHSRLYRLGRCDTPEARAIEEAEDPRRAAEKHARRKVWEARRVACAAADAAREAEAMALIEAAGGAVDVAGADPDLASSWILTPIRWSWRTASSRPRTSTPAGGCCRVW